MGQRTMKTRNVQAWSQSNSMGRVHLEKRTISKARQEVSGLLWNVKIHCYVHKIPTLVPFLSQRNPTQTLQPCFPKIHLNITLHMCALGTPTKISRLYHAGTCSPHLCFPFDQPNDI